jgi:hypothetical protein
VPSEYYFLAFRVDEHGNLLFLILILTLYPFFLLAVSLGSRLVHYPCKKLLWEYLMRAKRGLAAAAYDGGRQHSQPEIAMWEIL